MCHHFHAKSCWCQLKEKRLGLQWRLSQKIKSIMGCFGPKFLGPAAKYKVSPLKVCFLRVLTRVQTKNSLEPNGSCQSRNSHQGLIPNYEKLKCCKCGTPFPPNLGRPDSRKHSTKLEKPNFKLESNLESKNKVHEGGFRGPKILGPGL